MADKNRISAGLRAMRAISLPQWVAYLVVVGGLAGLFSWMLMFAGHLVFEIPRPNWTALFWAIPRGGLFAVVLGLVLRWYWNRSRG